MVFVKTSLSIWILYVYLPSESDSQELVQHPSIIIQPDDSSPHYSANGKIYGRTVDNPIHAPDLLHLGLNIFISNSFVIHIIVDKYNNRIGTKAEAPLPKHNVITSCSKEDQAGRWLSHKPPGFNSPNYYVL